jgi:transposase
MIQLTPQSKILLATDPIDFRKGIDGIAAICANEFKKDPSSGTLFVFINRARTQVRVLFYDGTGFWLMSKRLSQGKYPWWPKNTDENVNSLCSKKLTLLLWGQNPERTSLKKDFKKVA